MRHPHVPRKLRWLVASNPLDTAADSCKFVSHMNDELAVIADKHHQVCLTAARSRDVIALAFIQYDVQYRGYLFGNVLLHSNDERFALMNCDLFFH